MVTETGSSDPKTFSMLGETLDSAAEALEAASVNLAKSAKKAAKTTKSAIGIGFHKAAYGISYGVVYAAVFLVELLPDEHVIRRGFVEGAEAALDAREKAKASKKVAVSKNTRAKRTTVISNWITRCKLMVSADQPRNFDNLSHGVKFYSPEPSARGVREACH